MSCILFLPFLLHHFMLSSHYVDPLLPSDQRSSAMYDTHSTQTGYSSYLATFVSFYPKREKPRTPTNQHGYLTHSISTKKAERKVMLQSHSQSCRQTLFQTHFPPKVYAISWFNSTLQSDNSPFSALTMHATVVVADVGPNIMSWCMCVSARTCVSCMCDVLTYKHITKHENMFPQPPSKSCPASPPHAFLLMAAAHLVTVVYQSG